jgi:hypothetical protein
VAAFRQGVMRARSVEEARERIVEYFEPLLEEAASGKKK